MPTLSSSHRRHIEQIVTPQRSRFDERERRVYSHDAAVLPAPMRAFAGACLADGVVQPATELELGELLRYASEHAIPVVPRGKGTAGYGGAVPTHGGLVVDLSR